MPIAQDLSWSGGDSQCPGLTATYDVYFGTVNPPPVAGNDLASTEWYDPSEDEWRPGPELSRTRQHLGVAARRGTVFAVGGRSPNLDSVERLRFRNGEPAGEWQEAPSLGFSRSGHGAATVDAIVSAVAPG